MSPPALIPAGYEELQRSELTRLFGRMVGLRMSVAPVAATLVLLLAAWEPAPWRRVVLVALPAFMLTLSLVEWVRYRRLGMGPRSVELNLLAFVAVQLLGSFATGGLESPAMPLVLVLTLLLGVVAGPDSRFRWAALSAQLAAPWLFAVIAVDGAVADFNLRAFGGGARSGHGDGQLWTAAVVYTLGTSVAHTAGVLLRRVFDGMLWRALEANDSLRREQAERSQSLVTLTGELAHELKNPLASVKGLSALLVQHVGEGKGLERLTVLRGEIDRMQGVLDEFLNFSRPLLPLSVEAAELRALCEDVAALHEGLARERGVTLEVEGTAQARCDARKVRQVLINLVQNALDVSPRGARIELRCAGAQAAATVRVLDRGPGLDPAVLPRLFQPGATTKPHGTGVGLTFARALARQHGGELELGPREGGGCAAVLTLPVEPALRTAEAEAR